MKATHLIIDENADQQRLDNFLISHLKGVPTSRIYRAVRKGEVRVNKKRVDVHYRLQQGDEVRVPPIRVATRDTPLVPTGGVLAELQRRIMIETDDLIIIAKPSGIPVHGGTGVHTGLIEGLRALRPAAKFLELVHRLDRDTSGCLLIAKKRRMLLALHQALLSKQLFKQYLTLVKGQWQGGERRIEAPLQKNVLQSGERMVKVDDAGKPAVTIFRPITVFKDASLIEARPLTGRTHQIRVHALHAGHPIAGDEKYGDRDFNLKMRHLGLKRLFLHAAGIYCRLPEAERVIAICAILDEELMHCLAKLAKEVA